MSLSVWQRNIVTESGNIIPDAEIEVFDAGTSNKPDLFSDADGNTQITNPFNATATGFARFYVAGGRYDIAVNGSVIWQNVALGTAQQKDTGTGENEVPTNTDIELRQYDFDQMPLVDGNPIVESDSNSDGEFTRFADGTQECWRFGAELTFSSTVLCSASPSFPVPFVNSQVMQNVVFESGLSLGEQQENNSYSRSEMTEMVLYVRGDSNTSWSDVRAESGAIFSSGDSVMVDLHAIGRWF